METKEFNLVEILKGCPKGTPLYSLLHGEVKFESIFGSDPAHPIIVEAFEGARMSFDKYGRYVANCGSCVLYPSKENRDWTTFRVPIKVIERFDPKTLKPYDKVLGRDNRNFMWDATFFSHIDKESGYPLRTVSGGYKQLIPFKGNEHLVGKCGEPDEHYRYWEEEEDGQTAST